MELEELKTLWLAFSEDQQKQERLSRSLILQMTRINYRNRIAKIIIPETAGILFCLVAGAYVSIAFSELDTWYLKMCGVISIMTLVLLSVLSVVSFRRLQSVGIEDHTYKETIASFAGRKIKFLRLQKWNFYLAAILLLAILPVLGKQIGGKDLFLTSRLWFMYVVIYPFYYGYASWVFKRYSKAATGAYQLLNGLDD